MDVKVLKLITGEEILGEIESESETEYVVISPVGISIVRNRDNQPSVGFSPFPLHSDQKKGDTVCLAKKHVVYCYVPAEDFISNYIKVFGSGIITPSQQIITG